MTSRKLKVLAWPARRKRLENPYSYLVQLNTAPYEVETAEFGIRSLLRFGWDVIHIHWPDMVLLRKGRLFQSAACSAILLLLWLQRKLGGAKLVWTVHNITPHEQLYPGIGNWYMNRFVNMLDGILSPSQHGLTQISAKYPRLGSLPSSVTPIGHYRDEYGQLPEKAAARKQHGWSDDEKILLSFGLVRPYKNLPKLAEEVSKSKDDKLRLVIAGPIKEDDEKALLESRAKNDDRITLHLGYIDQELVPSYFAAADIVVLPFKNILNSSSALLALSCDRQVVAPAIGAIPELCEMVGDDWVLTYEGEVTTEIIEESLKNPPATTSPNLNRFEWSEIGRLTAELFRKVADR